MDLKFPVKSYASQYIFLLQLVSVPDHAISVADFTGFYVIFSAAGPTTYKVLRLAFIVMIISLS